MKRNIAFILLILGILSCSRQKEVMKSASELNSVPVQAGTTVETTGEQPLVERTEKLVEVQEKEVAELSYFVIIGSFRSKENALKYQQELGNQGFTSNLLRNEEGLYRVSIKATDDINQARGEIRRIRQKYPQHSDTWLLIRKR